MSVDTGCSLPTSRLAFVPLLYGLILRVAAPSLAVFRTMLTRLAKDIATEFRRLDVSFTKLLLQRDKSDQRECGWVLCPPPRLAVFTVLGQRDDQRVPQRRSEGTSYNSMALKISRHIACFEAFKSRACVLVPLNICCVLVVDRRPSHTQLSFHSQFNHGRRNAEGRIRNKKERRGRSFV
jgi:hypothetical protein